MTPVFHLISAAQSSVTFLTARLGNLEVMEVSGVLQDRGQFQDRVRRDSGPRTVSDTDSKPRTVSGLRTLSEQKKRFILSYLSLRTDS